VKLDNVFVGIALTGSHCTAAKVLLQMEKVKDRGAKIAAIISGSVKYTDSRFGTAGQLREELELLTAEPIVDSILKAEPIGPGKKFDLLLVAPCTGNTLAKLANGITDTAVLMAVKAQLRNQKPVLLAIATNDALGLNAKNLGILLATKNIFFVPFAQDDPAEKPNSLVSNMELIIPAMEEALKFKQLQPVIYQGAKKNNDQPV